MGANGGRISPDQVETQVQDVTELPTPEEPKGSSVSPNRSADDKRATYHNKGYVVHATTTTTTNDPAEKALQSEAIPLQELSKKTKEPETHAEESTKKIEKTKPQEEPEKKTEETEPTKESKKNRKARSQQPIPNPTPKRHLRKFIHAISTLQTPRMRPGTVVEIISI